MATQPTPPPSWVMRIAGRIERWFGRQGIPTPPEIRPQDTMLHGVQDYSPRYNDGPTNYSKSWKVAQDRKNTVLEIDRMDQEDELVSTALDIVADFMTDYIEEKQEVTSIGVRSTDAEVQEILERLVVRLNLNMEVWQMVRDMYKYGAYYREVILDPSRTRIVALEQTRPYDIYPLTNSTGHKAPGWLYKTVQDFANNQPGVRLAEWQILPFYFGNRVGLEHVPVLAPARRNWNRLAKIEDSMAIARLTRSADKFVHRIPVKGNDTGDMIREKIRVYRENITKKRITGGDGTLTQTVSPFDVEGDFYLPEDDTKRGGVTSLSSGNAALSNLDDVYYHRERLIARLGVPMSYLQIMSTQKTHLRSGTSLASVDVAFAKRLRLVQASLRDSLTRLFNLELLLNGIAPRLDSYDIQLTPITTIDESNEAKVTLTYAQAAAYFHEAFGALPLELMESMFLRLSPQHRDSWDKFLKTYRDRIEKARVKSIETNAEPKQSGSGNQNKTRAARSVEQEDAAALLYAMQMELVEQGHLHPDNARTLSQISADLSSGHFST